MPDSPLTNIANLRCRTDANGYLIVTIGSGGGSGGTASSFGAAFPATGTAAGFIDNGGLMAGGTLDASGFLKVNVAAGGAGGGAVTVADAADVVEGALADAAVVGDNAGTISAKLRGLNKTVATSAKQDLQTADLDLIAASASVLDDWDESDRAKVNLIAGQVGILGGTGVDAANVPRVSLVTNVALPAGSALLGKVGIDQTTPGTTNAVSLPAIAAVATVTSVNDSASSQTLLSSNAARKGYKLFNDTTVVAYVKEGTTATTSDYSYQLQPGGYYEFGGVGTYTGRIDCIWASDASGAMKVTEVV